MAQYVKKIRTDAGDLQIDYNALANLPALNTMFSNPNLLINSDFRNPVNQRGKTSYTYSGSSVAYTIDRWCMNFNSVTTVNNGYITFTGNAANNNYWYQQLEHPLSGTFTISVYVKNTTYTNGIMYMYTTDDNGTVNHFSLNQGVKTITFEATNLRRVGFCALKTGASADVYWIKLEQSTAATSFVPRLYAEELALCQRYYEKRYVLFTPMSGEANTTYYNAINGGQHFVRKRTTPTNTASAFVNHNGDDVNVTVKSYAQNADSLRSVTLNQSCASYSIRAQIEFDAEIY